MTRSLAIIAVILAAFAAVLSVANYAQAAHVRHQVRDCVEGRPWAMDNSGCATTVLG